MPTLSYWEKQSFFGNIDIAIIGSGIVGLTTAIYLKKTNPKLEVAVFERGTLPLGASTRNAGFACFGSMTELLDDLSSRSEEEVFGLVETRCKGLANLRQLVGDRKLQYKSLGGFEIFKKEENDLFQQCADQIDCFNKLLKPITGHSSVFSIADNKVSPFGFSGIAHIINNSAEGQLNTGEMMKSLLKIATDLSVQTFYGIQIKTIEEATNKAIISTDQGWEITVRKVLVATNGFAQQLLPNLKITPARNQVLITEPIGNLSFKGAFHYDRGYYYFRNVEDPNNPKSQRILLGGGRNLSAKTEETSEFGHTQLIQDALEKLLRDIILPKQKIKIEGRWSGILGIGEMKKPIVEMVSPSIGVAVRLGGMGVAIGSAIGKQAAAMVLETDPT